MVEIKLISKSASISSRKAKTYNSLSTDRLAKKIARKNVVHPSRIRLSCVDRSSGNVIQFLPGGSLDELFSEDELGGTIEVFVQDTGPQISTNTARSLVNFGIILIHTIGFQYSCNLSKGNPEPVQVLTFIMMVIHFLREQYGPFSVNKSSFPTVPVLPFAWELIRSWGFYGLSVALEIYPTYKRVYWEPKRIQWNYRRSNYTDTTYVVLFTLWAIAQLGSYRASRWSAVYAKEDPRPVLTPRYYEHSVVAFPQYSFEALSWIIFSCVLSTPQASKIAVEEFGMLLRKALDQDWVNTRMYGDAYTKLNRPTMLPLSKPVETFLDRWMPFYFLYVLHSGGVVLEWLVLWLKYRA